MAEEKLNIHQKLLKVVEMAGVLQKSASGFNFKYVPEEEIQAKVTAGMKKYGLMLYPTIVPGTLRVEPQTYEKYDNKIKGNKTMREYLVVAETVNKWVNVDNPEEYVEIPWVLIGSMEDASQAFGAGATYCNRYFLMKTLQLATTEDDPDNYRSKQKAAENYEEDAAAKEAEEALKVEVKKVVDAGSRLIASGVNREVMMSVVAKYNDNNGNPATIKSPEVCSDILKEFGTIAPKKTVEKKEKTEQ